ncbi:hypothetical protein NPIL_240991 [Nephila pilipes]|uniref:Uncharacterized protein n=1 Tax=Nephila pilipes TaxID=299642 RepID=A0A8X6R981_NEPPI|nr:hypothetical protein NPIL_240991 [Nephila pilipes]
MSVLGRWLETSNQVDLEIPRILDPAKRTPERQFELLIQNYPGSLNNSRKSSFNSTRNTHVHPTSVVSLANFWLLMKPIWGHENSPDPYPVHRSSSNHHPQNHRNPAEDILKLSFPLESDLNLKDFIYQTPAYINQNIRAPEK